MTDQTDFLKVAQAAFARGFPAVTPLKGKHPFTHEWNTEWALRNEFDIEMAARSYPHNDCGLVMHKEVGLPFAWDVDKKGVLERLPQELLATYRVQTRPETAPHKQHIFFLHTPYSVSKFQKNINAGDYDLIGIGDRPLQVVAEGCVRPEPPHETRRGNGLAIASVPKWLVDWLLEDVKRCRKNRPTKTKIVIPVTDGVIVKGRRYFWLRWLAKWLVKFRLPRKAVLAEITRQCRLYCEDGIKYSDGSGKHQLRAIAYDKNLRPSDPLDWEPTEKHGLVVNTAPLNARQVRLLTISKFPDSITPAEVCTRLGLERGKKGANVLTRDMPVGGFKYDSTRNLWSREGTQ